MTSSSGTLPFIARTADRVAMQMAASTVGRGHLASEPARRVTEPPASGASGGDGTMVGAAASTAAQDAVAQPGRTADGRSSQQGDQGGKEGSFSGVRQETELTEEERKQVEELKARDQEVRTHESAHKSAGGQYVRGSASFTYQSGPDGKRYAIGGEVKIDTGKEDDPEKTLEKAETIRRAAMAPAEPSSKDRQVAAEAARMATEARMEIAQSRAEEAAGGGDAAGASGEAGGLIDGGENAGRTAAANGSSGNEREGAGRRSTGSSAYGALNQFNLTASAGRSNNLFVNVYA